MVHFAILAAGTFVLLAACATNGVPQTAASQKAPNQAAGEPAGSLAHAVILTVRPVPRTESGAVRLLPIGIDQASVLPSSAEYIVQTDDGTTLAIVQPAQPGLHPGQDVTISRADRATLITR